MTRLLTNLVPLTLPAAAVSVFVFGSAPESQAQVVHDDLPVACEFTTEDSAFGTTFQGIVHANEPIVGSYRLSFIKTGRNSTTINQAGQFDLDRDESATLGQASFGGNADVDALMTLDINGTTYACGSGGSTDL